MNDSETGIGKFFGIGVGPGDPELMTVKSLNILSRVPYIFVPQKNEESESLALSIINGQLKDTERKVTRLVFPMLRDESQLRPYWEKAAEAIWKCLEKGQDCAFINVGDPMLYGTFLHVLNILRVMHPQVKVEVVPGISSLNAAAAAAGFPLTINNERMAVISAEREEKFIREILRNFDTVVIFKVNMVFNKIIGILEEMNLINRCVYVQRCSTPEEEIIRDIRKLKGAKLDYFSILLVRKEQW